MPTPLDATVSDEPPMVLIASADGPTRISVARLAARLGLRALIALDGAAALTLAQSYDHSLICVVLDSHLSTLSGWEVARALQPLVADLPIVVLDQTARPPHHLSPSHIPTFSVDNVAGLSAYLGRLTETLALT